MILFALPPHTVETEPAWNNAPLRAWRWGLDVGRLYVGITEQVRFGKGEWGPAINYYFWIGLSSVPSRWHVGMHHTYYDGPHHALWLGPLYLNWSPLRACAKCWGDAYEHDEEDTSGAVQDFIDAVLAAAMGGAS